MSDHSGPIAQHQGKHPGYLTLIAVWACLVALTGLLVLLSHFGLKPAVLGLLTITPLKAGLVFYFFMHLRYEPPLLKGVVLIALGTLLIFFVLMYSEVAFR